MKKVLIAITSITLLSSSAFSQGMRDTLREYNSSERCFGDEKDDSEKWCPYGNGNIHYCPDFLYTYGLSEKCADTSVVGKLNHRFRYTYSVGNVATELHEYYLEGGNLVNYWCYEGAYMKCDSRPEKRVFYPL